MSDIKAIIYNCKQATFLIEKRLLSKLTFKEQVELQIHLAGCGVCSLYVKQSRKINAMIKQVLAGGEGKAATLNDAFKQNLQVQIEDKLNNKNRS